MGQKKAAQTRLSLHLSDCHLVGHHMSVIGQFTLIGMNIIRLLRCVFIIPPANFVCRGYTVFTLSVRASVRACVRPSVRNALFP